jgi:hypothetical protein
MDSPFVHTYNELSEEQKVDVQAIKRQAHTLYEMFSVAFNADPRCIAVAKTKLEEAVMWAVKGVTNPPQEQRVEKMSTDPSND